MNAAEQIMSGFDISDLETSNVNDITFDVAVMEDEDGNPICGFTIVGKNSTEYQDANSVVRVSNIKRAAKRTRQVDTSTDDGAALVARTVAQNEKILAMAVVKGWFGFLQDGSPKTFDKKLVEFMFTKYPQWQAKVTAALDNDANFMKASLKA